jgi:hypothetical protein
MKNKNFDYKQLAEFVRAQKDDRPIVMSLKNDPYNCGCILAHFGRKMGRRNITSIGVSSFKDDRNQFYSGDSTVFMFISEAARLRIRNYKQAKALLNEVL